MNCSFTFQGEQVDIQTMSPKQARRRRYKLNRKLKKAREYDVSIIGISGSGILYRTTGDRGAHMVVIADLDIAVCDCGNGMSPCSHAIAVKMFRKEGMGE